MDVFKIVMLGIAVVLPGVLLKNHKPVIGILLGIAGALLIMMITLQTLGPLLSQINALFSFLGDGASYFSILLKALGITYLCQFSSGICRDSGFQNLGDQIQIFGKIYIMLSGMPILLAFVQMIQEL